MNLLWMGCFKYHGMSRHILATAKELARQGHRVTLYMPGMPRMTEMSGTSEMTEMTKIAGLSEMPGISEMSELSKAITEESELEEVVARDNFDLIHLHNFEDPELAEGKSKTGHEARKLTVSEKAMQLSFRLEIPLMATLHQFLAHGIIKEWWHELSGIITVDEELFQYFSHSRQHGHHHVHCQHVCEGVDLNAYSPGENRSIPVLFLGDEDEFSSQTLEYLYRATQLARLPLSLLTPQKIFLQGKTYDPVFPWDISGILSDTDIVFTRGRGAAEAMACGCATFILGHTYGGPINQNVTGAPSQFIDMSGRRGSELCYKDIFFDLRKLMENPAEKTQLQYWSRNYAIRNFDLVMAAMRILEFYRKCLQAT